MLELVRIEEVTWSKGFGVLHPSAFAFYHEGDFAKGRTHKYIKREPYTTAAGKKKYRYWYRMPGNPKTQAAGELLVSSFRFQAPDGETGLYHITAVNGESVTIRHDETGKEIITNLATLKALLDSQAQPTSQASQTTPSPESATQPPKSPKSASSPSTPPSKPSSNEPPTERATVDSVVKQPPSEIAQDLDIYKRYKQRNVLQDLEESMQQFVGAEQLVTLRERILLNRHTFYKCLASLYYVQNSNIEILASGTTSKHQNGQSTISLTGTILNTKTGKVFPLNEGYFKRTITIDKKKIDIHNDYLLVPSEMRGNSLSMQIYQRQEDFFREITNDFPLEERRKIAITMLAALDVGKYFWMSQGFQYKDKTNREEHIKSLDSALARLSSSLSDPLYVLSNSQTSVQDILDAGVTAEHLETLQGRLETALKKSPPAEPWELLEIDKDLPRFTYKRWDSDQGKYISIDCGLIKYAALNGMSWHGIKYLHPETKSAKKAKEGHEYAERKRAEDAEKAEAKGKPWTWLNLPKIDTLPLPVGT